jgi:hypothetical protein
MEQGFTFMPMAIDMRVNWKMRLSRIPIFIKNWDSGQSNYATLVAKINNEIFTTLGPTQKIGHIEKGNIIKKIEDISKLNKKYRFKFYGNNFLINRGKISDEYGKKNS